jgi:hypothetical protein
MQTIPPLKSNPCAPDRSATNTCSSFCSTLNDANLLFLFAFDLFSPVLEKYRLSPSRPFGNKMLNLHILRWQHDQQFTDTGDTRIIIRKRHFVLNNLIALIKSFSLVKMVDLLDQDCFFLIKMVKEQIKMVKKQIKRGQDVQVVKITDVS